MPRIAWFVLNDGTSLVAGCGGATRGSFTEAMSRPETVLTFTSDDSVARIPTNLVREFVMFDVKSSVPAATAIYRLVHL